MIVLKQPKERKIKSKKVDHIAATIKSQKLKLTKISKTKKLYPTLLVTELLAKRLALIPDRFPSFAENKEIKNSMIMSGCRYERGGISPFNQEEHIQLDEKSDRVYDIAELIYSQGEKLLLSEQQDVSNIRAHGSDIKKSILIERRKDRSLQLKK